MFICLLDDIGLCQQRHSSSCLVLFDLWWSYITKSIQLSTYFGVLLVWGCFSFCGLGPLLIIILMLQHTMIFMPFILGGIIGLWPTVNSFPISLCLSSSLSLIYNIVTNTFMSLALLLHIDFSFPLGGFWRDHWLGEKSMQNKGLNSSVIESFRSNQAGARLRSF